MGKPNPALCLLLLAAACATSRAAADCGPEQYFHADDQDNTHPLQKPAPAFAKALRQATRGVAVEERNLAVYYESGYMVTRCQEKADYWYERAALHGDEVAKAALSRTVAFARLRESHECFGDACSAATGGTTQVAFLQASGPGGFATMVTINGKAVRGIIDTGASYVSISANTAKELGIGYENGRQLKMKTANGTVSNSAVVFDSVTVGGITVRNVAGTVGPSDMPVLIGMSFLKHVNMSTNGNTMTLVKP